jgi:hypothetical protein
MTLYNSRWQLARITARLIEPSEWRFDLLDESGALLQNDCTAPATDGIYDPVLAGADIAAALNLAPL